MWSKVDKDSEIKMLDIAIDFTGDHILYGEQMKLVSKAWLYSMINFLTNKNINRKAYIGHCAVSYKFKIPEYITRKAWKYLDAKQQRLANLQAEKTIKEWEQWYIKKYMITLKNGKKNAIKKVYQMKLQLK